MVAFGGLMTKGVPRTAQEVDSRRRAIFAAAAELFLAKGFQATPMREIAAAAGIGKSTLYDYFPTKDDILLFVVETASDDVTRQAQAVAALPLPPGERLRQIMRLEMDYWQANRRLLARLGGEVQSLGPSGQARIGQLRYAYQDLVRAVVQEGIDAGCFRPVDALLAARLLINSLISVLYTSRPTGSNEDMLEQTLTIFLGGLEL
jgi:AcrR family transcriptional regulator